MTYLKEITTPTMPAVLSVGNKKLYNSMIIEENKKLTYKELDDYSKKVGSFLASSNIINVPVVLL